MKIKTYGIHDQFALKAENKESLTIVSNKGINLAIDAPSHIVKSLNQDLELVSNSVITKVDYLLVTHTDNDHIGGLANLIWWKLFGEQEKLNIITHENIYKDLWEFLKRVGFGFDRTKESLKDANMSDYCNFYPIGYDESLDIKGFGKINTFSRATHHQEGMDVLAFKINDEKNNNILNFSSDTRFDSELIDFLFSSDGKVIHEIGAYSKISHSHTDINELISKIDKKEHSRLYVNHIPEIREEEIINTIKDSSSDIKFANLISKQNIS